MKNLTFISILRIAVKHSFLMIIIAAVLGISAFTYCKYFATPRFEATGSVLATNGAILNNGYDENTNNNSQVEYNDIIASLNIYDTTYDILKTNGIFKQLSEVTGNKYSFQNLRDRFIIKKSSEKNSLFIYIGFSATTPEEAIYLTNEYVKLVPNYVNGYMSNSLDMAITTCDSASQTYPRPLTTSLTAAVLGVAVTLIILVLVYSFNNVIQSAEEFEERYDIPLLGTVPNFDSANNNISYNSYYSNSNSSSKSKSKSKTKLEETKKEV